MITAQEIVELYKLRVKSQGPVLEQMRAIKQLANGEIIIPLNEKDRNEPRTLPVIGSEQSWRCGMQTAWKAKCAVEQGTCLLTPTLQ